MLKYFYFVNRNPAMTPETFQARWRRHAAMTTARPSWKNMLFYVQADRLNPSPIEGISAEFDGFCFGRPAENFSAGPEEAPALQALAEDELEIFVGPIPPRLIFVEPEILREGGTGIAACLAFDNAAQAREIASGFAGQSDLQRVVYNQVRRELSSNNPVDCAAIVELSAPTETRLKSALHADRRWRNAKLAMVAREHPLWDRREAWSSAV